MSEALKMEDAEQRDHWLSVVGRSLAFLCLVQADLRDKGLTAQANLLESLGLDRREAAELLDTTSDSLSVMMRREDKRKRIGGRRGTKKKGKY